MNNPEKFIYKQDDIDYLKIIGHDESAYLDGSINAIINKYGTPTERWQDDVEICLTYSCINGDISYYFYHTYGQVIEKSPYLTNIEFSFDTKKRT